ncbi:lactoylglutathione lyase [Fictibacillus enclensis]|uniref:Glyoxalase n=1 Tax=Fictibacillus enclensis TaxID=1017270 RepID=A0A0V8J220_9BACL|nr:VOC family protein [Fictibacillus enclensis]KSU81125.1 glyoxalase [Fictibacillus enclensis]SCC35318.1 lactoylglutathione lyase [Fictibacillus enclensis]
MFSKLGEVMLYVNDQDQAVKFWTEKAGFTVISEGESGPMRWIAIAPSKDSETTIVLFNKEVVAKMSPELNLGTPSLMFFTENLDELYKNLSSKNVNVGELVEMPSGRVFNFSDDEENYFAVMESH